MIEFGHYNQGFRMKRRDFFKTSLAGAAAAMATSLKAGVTG